MNFAIVVRNGRWISLIEAHFGSKRYQDCAEQLQMKFSNVPVTDKQTLHCDSVNCFRDRKCL